MKFVKPCPRIPGTHPADTCKLCKALSPDSRHTSCGHRQALQSPVPGWGVGFPRGTAKPCPRIPGTHPCGHRQALQSSVPGWGVGFPRGTAKPCPPVTVKQGGMTTAIPCKKKTAVKPPSRILFVFLITYGDSKPEGNSLSCKGTCKGW